MADLGRNSSSAHSLPPFANDAKALASPSKLTLAAQHEVRTVGQAVTTATSIASEPSNTAAALSTLSLNAGVPHLTNINVAVLGHVDSGKTSLVRALSTALSTAALDKSPQSQARGMTLDLGFSSFTTAPRGVHATTGVGGLQFTLVDCPGHASLIRTVIGGAQIVDMALLVIDAVKGIQTQTGECIVIAEITTDVIVVVLNKIDMLPVGAEGVARLDKLRAHVRRALASTKFASAPFVALSAAPGGAGKLGAAAPSSDMQRPADVAELVSLMASVAPLSHRSTQGPFLFAIDHCFAVRGQGTVLTGTVLAGRLSVNDSIELPAVGGPNRKVKSIQVFHKPVSSISQGDRAGICVPGLDAAIIERGIAATPGSVPTLGAAIALVRRVRFFRGDAHSGSKFHVTVAHTTVMATVFFFGAAEIAQGSQRQLSRQASGDEAAHVRDSPTTAPVGPTASPGSTVNARAALEAATLRRACDTGIPPLPFVWGSEFEWQPDLLPLSGGGKANAGSGDVIAAPAAEWQWAALLFEMPVIAPLSSLVIGSRLDADVGAPSCRLAFHGRLAAPLNASPDLRELRALRIYKRKEKAGVIDRCEPPSGMDGGQAAVQVVIGRGLFKKDADLSHYVGLRLEARPAGGRGDPVAGVLDAPFGKSGKFTATFTLCERSTAEAQPQLQQLRAGDAISLRYRKFLFDGPTGAKHRLEQ